MHVSYVGGEGYTDFIFTLNIYASSITLASDDSYWWTGSITANDSTYRDGKYTLITSTIIIPCTAMLQTVYDNIYEYCWRYEDSGSYTSTIYDTTFSTPIGGPYYFIDSVPDGSTVTYQVAQSSASDGGGFGSWVTVSTTTSGEYRIPFNKRYWKEKIMLDTSYSTQTPVITATQLDAATSGYYIADCVNAMGVTSWGNFRPAAIHPYSDSISYAINAGESCHAVTRSTAVWVAQSANTRVAASTGSYLGIRVFENPTSSTDTLRLDTLIIEWNEGNNRPPVASVIDLDRYYLFYTTNTVGSVYNDHALVLDSNNKWSIFNDIYAYSAVLYNNNTYLGDSRDSGYIYQYTQDNLTDDDSPFSYKIKTGNLALTTPVEKKVFKRLYLFLKSETVPGQDIDLTVKYYIDGSTTAYDLGSADLSEATEPGYFVAKFPVPLNITATFHWLSFSIEYDGTQGPVNIYGIKIVYMPTEWE